MGAMAKSELHDWSRPEYNVLEYIVREVYGRRYFNILCDEFGEKRFNKSKLV
jgi:hypothetical protein